MQILICQNPEQVATVASDQVADLIKHKPNAVLGLATGSTPIALYQQLVIKHQKQDLSFANTVTFNLDEYHKIDPQHPQSYRSFMQTNLFDQVDIDMANTHLPTCDDSQDPRQQGEAYEKLIKQYGGLDLQVLGIGANGHIGFNEPTSSLTSRTRIKTLTAQTLTDNSRLFKPDEYQPNMAMTMGIATIMESRKLLLLATGKNKAKAVKQMITGSVSAMCPASVLQLHENAVVVLDKDAASELDDQQYFEQAAVHNQQIHNQFGVFPSCPN